MRLLERTLKEMYIAPGLVVTDALGAKARAFSQERIPVRASLIPAEGALEICEVRYVVEVDDGADGGGAAELLGGGVVRGEHR